MMAALWALFATEVIKLRRTSTVWVALLIPLLMVVLHLVGLFDQSSNPYAQPLSAAAKWNRWLEYGWVLWLSLFAPMVVTFAGASLVNQEHRASQWKQLFTYPIPRWSVYAIKMLTCILLITMSSLLASLGFVANGLLVGWYGHFAMEATIPWAGILGVTACASLACWLSIAIQTWISVRFRGLMASVAIGFGGTVLGLMLSSIGRGAESPWGLAGWSPWTLPLAGLPRGGFQIVSWLPTAIGCLGGLLVAAIACWDLARRREGD